MSGRRLDRAETARKLPALDLERQRPCRIEHDDLGCRLDVRERAQQVEQPHAVDRNVAVALEPRIDRDQVIVAFELDRVARVIDERDGVGPGRLHLLEEVAEHAAEVGLVDVRALDDLETDAGQRFGDQPAIGERGLQRPLRIGGIADHQRDARLLRRLRLLGRRRQRDNKQRRERGEGNEKLAQHG